MCSGCVGGSGRACAQLFLGLDINNHPIPSQRVCAFVSYKKHGPFRLRQLEE